MHIGRLRLTAETKKGFRLEAFFCGGERGIRTPGTSFPVRQFSKLLVSATHPPLRSGCLAKGLQI